MYVQPDLLAGTVQAYVDVDSAGAAGPAADAVEVPAGHIVAPDQIDGGGHRVGAADHVLRGYLRAVLGQHAAYPPVFY